MIKIYKVSIITRQVYLFLFYEKSLNVSFYIVFKPNVVMEGLIINSK